MDEDKFARGVYVRFHNQSKWDNRIGKIAIPPANSNYVWVAFPGALPLVPVNTSDLKLLSTEDVIAHVLAQ